MEKSERDLFLREIYLRTENFYRSLLGGKMVDVALGPEIEDEYSRKYGLTYYGCIGEFEGDGFALKRGDKIIEPLSDVYEMPLVEDVMEIYLWDYLCIKDRIDEGKELSDTERMYKILFEDFFSKEEIEELIKEIR